MLSLLLDVIVVVERINVVVLLSLLLSLLLLCLIVLVNRGDFRLFFCEDELDVGAETAVVVVLVRQFRIFRRRWKPPWRT